MLKLKFEQPLGSALKVVLIKIESLQIFINKKCEIIVKNNIVKKKLIKFVNKL